jgi:hypothetical protein
MDDARTISWIFYAVEMATSSGPADYREISSVADGINHAVPTHKELQTSLTWLANAGLVSKSSGGYSLTTNGTALITGARKESNTVMKVWASLTQAIEHIQKSSSNPALKQDAPSARPLAPR